MPAKNRSRSWLERNIVGVTMALLALVFLLVGLLLGGVFSRADEPRAEEGTTTSSVESTTPPTSSTSTMPTTSTSTTTSTATTATTATGASTTTTLPEWLLTLPDPIEGAATIGPLLGEQVDLDTFTTPCNTGCDLEITEILGITADGYQPVISPLGGAEIGELVKDPNLDVISAWATCNEAEAIVDANKVGPHLYEPDDDAAFFCVRTDEGNWALLLVTTPNDDFPNGVYMLGHTVRPPGWDLDRMWVLFPIG